MSAKKKSRGGARAFFAAVVIVIAVIIVAAALRLHGGASPAPSSSGAGVSSSSPSPSSSSSSSGGSSAVTSSQSGTTLVSGSGQTALGGLLMLVNKENALPESYTPNFVTVPASYYVSADKDRHFDSRAAPYLEQLIDAGRAAGYNLVIYSGYRSYESQQDDYDRHVKEYEAEGKTAAQAKAETEELVAPPGTSEHETGLAADIVTTDYLKTNSDLEADVFDKTAAFTWLDSNCAKYGFILRYPKDKVASTGYDYESWHFRFVGVSDAEKIMSNNLTLEEYDSTLH